MPVRVKKLIGLVLIVAWVIAYSVIVVTIGDMKLATQPGWVKGLYFVVAGLAWVMPLMPLIAWMQRPPRT